jgi:integrase
VNSFNDILDIVNSKRIELKEKIKTGETLRPKKEAEQKEENEKVTFLEKVEEFLKDKEISKRKSTMTNYRTALLTHSKDLHNREFSTITIKDIQKIVHKLLELKRAPATVALYARTIGAFFKKHKKEISIDFEDLELPEVDNKVDYKLSLDDTKRIIKVLREYSKVDLGNGETFYQYEEIKNIFAFSLTGRRISEIINLKFSDLNFESNTFKIPAITSKGKKELEFDIDNYLLEALQSQARLRNIDLYSRSEAKIFTYTKETARVHFQNIIKALKLPKLRLHDIRHMLGTTLVQNGVPIQDISRMLGHSSIAITEQRYAKPNKDQATRATNAFNSLME